MKRVLFTQRVELVGAYKERRDCADQRIAEYINSCGFLPVPIPNCVQFAEQYIQELHPSGLILTGGNSLEKYGGNAPDRDETEVRLLELAVKYRMPVFGFCRGMQVILDFFGCDLIEVKDHAAVRHEVYSGLKMREVNSYHNQACIELPESSGLLAVAKAEDGVIEAVRHKKLPIAGVMWHPEREPVFTAYDQEIIRKMFGEIQNGGEQ